MDLSYQSENGSVAERSTMPPAPATTSNGYTVVASDDDDCEHYEVLDNVHSDFLQHFENEIRISPLCVEENAEILDDLVEASLANDNSRVSKKWKKLHSAADGVISESSSARGDSIETSQTLLHSRDGMPPVTDQYVTHVGEFYHVQTHASALGSLLATG
jgi:hypothetical protein